MRIYNTATRQVEEFTTYVPRLARGYVCGITPYDHMHVGHGRVYVFFDIFRRYLERLGYEVRLVINFTDIDDKIVNKAREEFGHEAYKRWREVPERYIAEYFEMTRRLYIKPAYAYPKVTENVEDMVKWISTLVEKGYAYVAPDGSVYFEVAKVPNYGVLSRQKIEELIAGARVEPEPGKRNPLDFALWKSWTPGEPWWNSPWCPGRPGWHLECVVMSTKHLGAPFDFHGGGADLIFPHHENEIAIARAYFGVDNFARYWIHVGYLTVRGEKMSKSLGNIITLREVLSKHSGEALRLAYAMSHYRKPMEFTYELLQQAEDMAKTLYTAYDELSQALRDAGEKDQEPIAQEALKYAGAFYGALDDDMSTPEAVQQLYGMARYIISTVLHRVEKISRETALAVLNKYVEMADVLGVLERRQIPKELEEAVKALVETRARLRQERQYQLADYIRQRLAELGVELHDFGPRTYYTYRRA
ncbi:cysteine--tRNA ligase [Pyrobaculum neutrophilum]|uniref:Cysteine--tRNA ligase n=1 Tax=Pyrobaculum neutrophilum (strain DSM 2338 / JCM 9278 / NBRC 100436 / V24Sta) TaxID=444157 RepID=SYC_PYRNV|nr:cysteine--tRNA ligase [Pyrobaculum neutrophilum]B1YA45.1 RecName: Full=Cysteine--tRNA ligase; AltName: Full=Cysteinyl-tRNA synthetase; Short=CysRS [Pyrobaculum neutrophilum V24Sta]ACB39019.1 cysteinyl-tRNA synthetase [Pyrobaculum neutrophilum V24Sta]